MTSEIPIPSPDALSPSGTKPNSQFYPSYTGSNPRRRPSQDPIGKGANYYFRQGVEHLETESSVTFIVLF